MASGSKAPPRTYRSSCRETQARATRQRVIEAASVKFLERGYGAVTMRSIAAAANVAVPTVELLFGTKPRLLKAAVDAAIAGDDVAVAVLDRSWTAAARAATTAEEVLAIVAGVVAPAQVRSSGLVLAVFQGASTSSELNELATQLIAQRATTAEWIVDRLADTVSLRDGRARREMIDTVWVLMDPAVFDRLTRHRAWTVQQYEHWIANSIARLLVDSAPTRPTLARKRRST